MKMLNLSIGAMIWRLHIMSAIVVTLGFLGFLYVGIVIGVLLFLATLMGIQLKHLNPFRHVTHKPYDWEHQHRHLHRPVH